MQAMSFSGGSPAVATAQPYGDRVFRAAKGLALNGAARLRSQFSEWEIGTRVVKRPAAWGLIEAADDRNVNLVVVGTVEQSAVVRLVLGSVSKRVVTDSHHSVRVARFVERKRKDALRRILVGVDGSPAADQAIFAVGQRVWQDGTEVRLVAVDDSAPTASIAHSLPQAAAMIKKYFRDQEARVSAMREWATNELNVIGLTTTIVTDKGDAKDVLLANTEEWNADCIFVGTRDFRSGLERL